MYNKTKTFLGRFCPSSYLVKAVAKLISLKLKLCVDGPHHNYSFYFLSLAARVLWRIHKNAGIMSDSQLISVDQLEDHVADLSEEARTQLNADVQTFLQFWSHGRKKHDPEYISHIFGIVSLMCVLLLSL